MTNTGMKGRTQCENLQLDKMRIPFGWVVELVRGFRPPLR
jgi:hypothetical protein